MEAEGWKQAPRRDRHSVWIPVVTIVTVHALRISNLGIRDGQIHRRIICIFVTITVNLIIGTVIILVVRLSMESRTPPLGRVLTIRQGTPSDIARNRDGMDAFHKKA